LKDIEFNSNFPYSQTIKARGGRNMNKWGNRDWYWLVGILISIIILIVSSKSAGLEVNFSIISSAASMALALVAIFFSFKQDTENQRTNSRLHETITRMDEKINNVGEKVNKFDSNRIIAMLENSRNAALSEIENDISNSSQLSGDEVKALLKNKIDKTYEDVNSVIHKSFRDKNRFMYKHNNPNIEIQVGSEIPFSLLVDIFKEYQGEWLDLATIHWHILNKSGVDSETIPLLSAVYSMELLYDVEKRTDSNGDTQYRLK
jgi:hypothetical protein